MEFQKTRRSYDALAGEYTAHIASELDHRPQERDLLRRFATRYRDQGLICDLGCGPGHIAGFAQQFHPGVFGLDLSSRCLLEASPRNPKTAFVQGDMLSLPFPDSSLAGAFSFYSLIHFDDSQVDRALGEMKRVLRPSGGLLLGFHVGTKIEHVTELWGISVDLDARFFLTADLVGRLQKLGLSVVEKFERDPQPELEYPSVRGYVWAAK